MPSLYLHDTRTGAKRKFRSLIAGEVGLYVCGITVYDDCHIGHARCMLAFDILYRFLGYLGYRVRYVRNITDIDDKIISRAAAEEIEFSQLTERYIRSMHEDFAALSLLPPDVEPLATQHIPQMIDLIGRLIEKDCAYAGSSGDIFFSVRQDADYGSLSGRNLEDMLTGARVESNPAKRDPLDFALWKLSNASEPGWDSPWGRGRPGWHVECSAMSMTYLGGSFDIHGGGFDLCFPHHENEWAQSRCAHGVPFAGYWLHSGFVRAADEKMSKSLGNTVNIKQISERFHPEVLRWFFLLSHYRSEVAYSESALEQADRSLRRFYLQFDDDGDIQSVQPGADDPWLLEFTETMCDDLNTPRALAVLHKLDKHINKVRAAEASAARALAATLRFLGSMLGLFGQDARSFLRGPSISENARIDEMVEQRLLFRRQGRWAEADQIREQLERNNIAVEDRPDGSKWYRLAAPPVNELA
ncbi:MAG: cysteine--tRNA ligase [Gammaproteobacteria bacterium]|nr:cysteine--tRNA ligase [Pseudomonadota bacterium]MCH9663890.1 cysteine--tRNA ligase [Gammaproteobacteria bacterium]